MRILLLAALVLCAASLPARAQDTGVISGVVLDDAGKPVTDADVVASAHDARARTDSAGRFELVKLPAENYVVSIRRLGFFPTRVTADLSHGGRANLHVELKMRPAILDSVVIFAGGGPCPDRQYSGFLCRKQHGKGLFLTDDDIFDKNARELGDIFRDVRGFRIELRPTPYGQIPIPLSTQAGLCLNALVNGRLASPTNPLPRFADELIAAEIYASPSDIPEEYQRYAWGAQGRESQVYRDRQGSSAGRCALVVYWTRF